MKRTAIIGLAVGCVAIVGLGATYFFGKNYYKTHLYPGTTINGVDCGNMIVEDAKGEIQFEMDNYTLTISERGGMEDTLKGKDMEFLYTDNGDVDKILAEQNPASWIFHSTGTKDYQISNDFTYNEELRTALVTQLQCFQAEHLVQPVDATVLLKETGFEIEPEVEGSMIYPADVDARVKTAIENDERSLNLEAEGLYVQPAIRQDNPDLLAKKDSMNAILGADVTYDFIDIQYHCGREELARWITQAEDGSVVIDRECVNEFVRNMAYDTDTFGLAKDFVTSYGHTITLEGGGDYGYCIDQEATQEQLMNFINNGEQVVTEPVYLFTGLDRRGNTIGNSYVEICISTQTLWLYWDGRLICSTPIITGCDAKGYSTPSGSVWAIDGKKEDWWFTTFPDAWSHWWMPFNDQVGLHDARWQEPEYYEIPGFYVNNGSHGCVNIPDAAMEQIFYYMEIGYPVVCYYSEDQVVGPSPTEELGA